MHTLFAHGGPDIINFTHWLGALSTSMYTIPVFPPNAAAR